MIAEDAAWNAALVGWFFRKEFANRPVFLCVDEETLEVLGRESGVASANAVQALAGCVRARVRTSAPFDSWLREATAWRRSGYPGPPPFVALLAVTVLAATLPGEANDRSYYRRLRDLLGLAGHGMPKDFDSDIQQLWSELNEWLDDVQHAQLGTATATNRVSAFPNVGWALSQTVLRPADRAKLPFLFAALSVYPGQLVEGQVLVAGLLRSGLSGHGMSRRLAVVLETSELREVLGQALARELATWDGTLRDEAGRRTLELLLTFHERRREFGAAVRTPPDLAGNQLHVAGPDGPVLGEAGELELVPVTVDDQLLDGASLSADVVDSRPESEGAEAGPRQIHLVMPYADVHVLTANDGLARWVDTRAAELGRRHLVLVRAALARDAVTIMEQLGDAPPRRTSVSCPGNWVSYQFEPVRSRAIDGPLSRLGPHAAQVSRLDGGLAVSRRARLFLTDGPPDVLVDLAAEDPTAVVDGQTMPGRALEGGRLRLSRHGLAAGRHTVVVGGTELSFRLVDEYAVGPADCALGEGLRADTSAAGAPWTVPVGRGLPGEDADVVVRGASVDLVSAAARRRYQDNDAAAQAQARLGGRHYALASGRIAVPITPAPPAWLLTLDPQPVPYLCDLRACTAELDFEPRWYLRITRDRATVARGSRGASGARPASPSHIPADNAWDQVQSWLSSATPEASDVEAWTAWLRAESIDDGRPAGGDRP